ncbi:MAG: dTMP kinase [Acidobacteria bacterium]|nr:dTMP kinase [Acidobacteriota bacterium]
MAASNGRGLFITFEGIDGSGKTTQMRLLINRLRERGATVLESAEPGGTPIGRKIRELLLDPSNRELSPAAELILYFAARAQNVDQWIRPALERGEIVVSDRWTDSTLAYQGGGRGLGESVVWDLDRVACRGIEPGLTIFIDVDLATSAARTNKREQALDRLEVQPGEFHQRTRDAYLRLARRFPARFRVIDGSQPPEAVAEAVWQAVQPELPA